jgi:hypothetical protein
MGTAGPGRTILAMTVNNWVIDKLAALGTDLEDRRPKDVVQRLPRGPLA